MNSLPEVLARCMFPSVTGYSKMKSTMHSLSTVLLVLPVLMFSSGCGMKPADSTIREATLSSGDVGRSTAAVSPTGDTAYFAWVERDSTGWNVWLSSWVRGREAPDPSVRVNATPGNAAAHDQAPPQVAVDTEGRVHVAWINRIDVPGRRFPANDLFLAVSKDQGKTFGPEMTVNSDAGGLPAGHTFHNLTRLPDGAMLVSWIDGRKREQERTTASMPQDPANGSAHVAAHSGSGSEIRVARVEEDGTRIRETAVLDTSSCPCCRTSLAVAPSGRIFTAWRHEFESGDGAIERDIVVAHSDDGGETFSDPRPVHRDHWKIDACPHTGPTLAVTANGNVHVAWYTGVETSPGIFLASSNDEGLTFKRATNVLQNVPVSQAALLMRPDGVVELLTEDRSRNGVSSWIANRQSVTWQAVVPDAVLPSAAADGNVAARTWRQSGRLTARVQEWS